MNKILLVLLCSFLLLGFQNCGNIILSQKSQEERSLACVDIKPQRMAHTFNSEKLSFWLENAEDLERSGVKADWTFAVTSNVPTLSYNFSSVESSEIPTGNPVCRKVHAQARYESCGQFKNVNQEFELNCTPDNNIEPPPPNTEPEPLNYCQQIANSYGMERGGLTVNRLGNFRLGSSQNFNQPVDGIPYFTIPFTVSSANYSGSIIWVNFGSVMPDFIQASISPCEGDFRPVAPASSDPFLKDTCRQWLMPENPGLYSSTVVNPAAPSCKLEQGKSYFINLKFLTASDISVTGYRGGCNPEWSPCNVVIDLSFGTRL